MIQVTTALLLFVPVVLMVLTGKLAGRLVRDPGPEAQAGVSGNVGALGLVQQSGASESLAPAASSGDRVPVSKAA